LLKCDLKGNANDGSKTLHINFSFIEEIRSLNMKPIINYLLLSLGIIFISTIAGVSCNDGISLEGSEGRAELDEPLVRPTRALPQKPTNKPTVTPRPPTNVNPSVTLPASRVPRTTSNWSQNGFYKWTTELWAQFLIRYSEIDNVVKNSVEIKL